MTQKKKIAVLGGGVSSMVSVYEITSQPNWQEHYEITVYQYGWRIGGKCASGRNPEIAQRIEEHGLHLWFGFYDNSFDFIQRVYQDNNRPDTHPLATWQEALKPCNFAVLEENPDGQNKVWENWAYLFPSNDEVPGMSATPQPKINEMYVKLLGLAQAKYRDGLVQMANANHLATPAHQNFLKSLEGFVGKEVSDLEKGLQFAGVFALEQIINYLKELTAADAQKDHSVIMKLISDFLASLQTLILNEVEKNPELTKIWIIMELGLTIIKGSFEDGIFWKGFDCINDIDLKAWLLKHGASKLTAECAIVQAIYSLIFAGRDQMTTEAGTGLRGMLLLGLFYKGSFYYRMQAGMGDTIFTPVYEVLKKRGVQFKFFHWVKELQLSADQKSVEAIVINQQVNLVSEEYQPLVNVKGLPCWPSEPFYDQLVEGKIIKEKGINLEDPWADWQGVNTVTLTQGNDFDLVLYGMPIGTIPGICADIVKTNEAWNNMVTHIATIPTQALQLWLKPDLSALGWPYTTQELPIVGTYVEPYDTYADMSDLLLKEAWDANINGGSPGENYWPGHIAYFCGPIMDVQFPPYSDHGFPAAMLEKTKAAQIDFLNNYIKQYWPNAVNQNEFRWELLVDYLNRTGVDRLNSQYSRVNLSPSELYVLSVVNSSKYRLEPWESGYDNLILTGDWTRTGINAGCVEASVIAGKKAANFINGIQAFIPWANDVI